MTKTVRAFLLPVVIGLMLAACAAPPAAQAPAAPAAPATQTTAAPAMDSTAAMEARVLRIRFPSDLVNADPAFHPAGIDTLTAETVGEGLFTFKPGTWELQPVLAESYQVSDDGLRIDFKLREGVQFQKGQGELTAEDVKFSYERFLDEKLDASYKGDWEALDKVEVKDKYNGTIVLKRPFAPLWGSTLPVAAGIVLSKKYTEEIGPEKYATSPLGTGPYEFAEWKPNERVILKRNEGYWGEKPFWDEIHFVPIKDDGAAEIALEAGEIDFTSVTEAGLARFTANDKFTTQSFSTMDYAGVFINVQHPKLSDINVRQAIRYAIDADAINQAVHEGKFERMCAIVAPSQIGYWADAPCYARDVDKAKEFMQQAGVEALDLTLVTEDSDTAKAKAEIIQANLKDIGINVTIKPEDGGAYWDGGFGEKAAKERELVLFDWGTNNPDPHWQMVWFSCEQVGQYNWMYWCDQDFDQANLDGTTTLDNAKRGEAYIRAQQLWDTNANVVWTLRPTGSYAWRAGLVPAQQPTGLEIPTAFRLK
jgi:peptide/nickel transport system substrate-binding protein